MKFSDTFFFYRDNRKEITNWKPHIVSENFHDIEKKFKKISTSVENSYDKLACNVLYGTISEEGRHEKTKKHFENKKKITGLQHFCKFCGFYVRSSNDQQVEFLTHCHKINLKD